MAVDYMNISAMGLILMTLGSLSIGLEIGVVMAGRSDGRGTHLHLVGSGIWGGCFSLLAGILTMMAESRLHPLLPPGAKRENITIRHKFHVVPFYRKFFLALFALSVGGFCSAIITISISSALVSETQTACDYQHVHQLWLYFELFCYSGIASIVLIPIAIFLLPLHLIMIVFCARTVRQPYWICKEDYEQLQQARLSGTSSVSSLVQLSNAARHSQTASPTRPSTSPPYPGQSSSSINAGGGERKFQFGPARTAGKSQSLRQSSSATAVGTSVNYHRSVSEMPGEACGHFTAPSGGPFQSPSRT
ncbi:hypothetical protein BV898_07309 [Hypsibius exemplaris]|uniref:Transmembrane protein n=1 Tax=Hypsibius exemplaris TaxID=2072580 RepID=A0A1W0WTY7_HYPEX|nr:hypothetical protein BV898_07309 [Hypsibius exemplaris]